eukprot:CAMPEP_0182433936 /NCGR_PEP_ID=MMETSP1167-20130531/66521_1 /TAXON_ID=2988 /ORGANISM="Mallomonas Sp, Strain CCMP3275" /LENGTH=136 /DNA_ID=CAMNT_0024623215 /DNA_START=97 /DNA_END=503 /DNA_ORIENTATION=+
MLKTKLNNSSSDMMLRSQSFSQGSGNSKPIRRSFYGALPMSQVIQEESQTKLQEDDADTSEDFSGPAKQRIQELTFQLSAEKNNSEKNLASMKSNVTTLQNEIQDLKDDAKRIKQESEDKISSLQTELIAQQEHSS